MASPAALREVRVICSTTFASNHSNAAASPWTTATKMQPSAYDDSGLKQDGFADDTLKVRMFDQGSPTPGLSRGAYKMTFRGLGSYSNTDATPEQILLNAVFGGIALPATNRNVPCAAGSDVHILNITDINSYLRPGQALLVGRKGDGRGNGEVKPVLEANAGAVILGIACNAAPSEGDQVVISTTVFLDEDATQSYIDHLAIGAATDDQKQTVGGMGKVTFSGLGMSERPGVEFDMTPADWRTCPSDARASLQKSTAPSHGSVAFGKGIGMLQLGDYGSNTRAVFKYAELSHDPGLAYSEVPDPSGVNGVGGWQKSNGVPKMTVTLLYDDDMPGLYNDFQAGTAKTVVAQFGHQQGKTFAIEQGKAYVDDSNPSKAAGPLSGVQVTLHGTDDYNASSNIKSAAVRYHMF